MKYQSREVVTDLDMHVANDIVDWIDTRANTETDWLENSVSYELDHLACGIQSGIKGTVHAMSVLYDDHFNDGCGFLSFMPSTQLIEQLSFGILEFCC